MGNVQEGDTTVEVNIDLLAELLLTLEGGHHLGDGTGVLGDEGSVLGVLAELVKLLEEVERLIEITIVTLLILCRDQQQAPALVQYFRCAR